MRFLPEATQEAQILPVRPVDRQKPIDKADEQAAAA